MIFNDGRYRNNTIAATMTAQVLINWPRAPTVPRGSIVPETFDETRRE